MMTADRSVQPHPQRVATIMHQLKGAPLSLLIVMGYFNRTMGRDELAMMTSYSPATVGRGLEKLAFMGLAQQHARFSGWMLTSKARQLPLLTRARAIEAEGTAVDAATEPATPSAEECGESRGVKNLHLGSSSCSHGFDSSGEVSVYNNYQTLEVQNLHLGADGEEAVGLLVATGMPATSRKGNGARDAVAAALAGGWSEAEVLEAVEGWLAYANSDRGAGVQHHGFFTGSKVRQRIQPPAQRELTRDEQAAQYIEQALDRIVRH